MEKPKITDADIDYAIEELRTNSIWYDEETQRDIDIVCDAAKFRVACKPKSMGRLYILDKAYNVYICSNCGIPALDGKDKYYPYCPNCGQKIDWSKK